jgi:DNA-binding transcriptional LysR family regulator
VSYESLKLFKDIATIKSFSRGAELNALSQSAASQSVSELEKSLGIPLLDRSTRPLSVTRAGKLYAEFCRDVLRRREEFDEALRQLKEETEGTVRVASIYSVGLSEMVQIEQEFGRREPEAHLEVEYLRPEKVYSAVTEGDVDLGLVSYPEGNREIQVIPWRMEEMVLAASPFHPLAQRGPLDPREMEGLDFIGFDEELPIRQAIDRFLRAMGVRVNRVFHFDNLQMIKEAVAQRVGVSIMPARIMLSEIQQGRLVAIRFAGRGLYRPLGIIHLKRKRFERIAQAFLDLLCEEPGPEFEAL